MFIHAIIGSFTGTIIIGTVIDTIIATIIDTITGSIIDDDSIGPTLGFTVCTFIDSIFSALTLYCVVLYYYG